METTCTGVFSFGGLSEEDILTMEKMAEVFQCSIRTVQRMVERNELPHPFRLGGKCCWRCGTVTTFLASKQAEAQRIADAERDRLAAYGAY